ncbi:hypothetical protein SAMN06266787_1143 [Halorubrum ezzemoulense]|uniref:Uncharacterized protein n=1 Tax=Halorubrum ezzemoulense TaxID=337243 RepID=A0A238YM48_HALEZ|nr:hypothetical protein [Halorubrum ezzemoulense]SNR71509.1 hypothetical protein SAMN06266787_1143 [Halorubrum ezzemoulense]
MSIQETRISDEALTFPEGTGEASVKNRIEGHLRYHYSRRLFVQDVEESEDGYYVKVGIAYPRDVSDCRKKDNVLKMVNIGDVKTLYASPMDEGYYRMNLPERSDLYAAFKERHKDILTRLDWSMARAIYSKVYELTPVRNQLNSVIEIVDFIRHEAPDSVRRLENAQTTSNTRDYLDVFEELGYVRIEDGMMYQGPKMESADIQGLQEEDIIGDIIDEGYYLLRQKLGLAMLNHFPKFANAYYLSALRRSDPELHLSVEDIAENLQAEYQDDTTDTWKLGRKLDSLHDVGVLKFQDREVTSREDVYNSVEPNIPSLG